MLMLLICYVLLLLRSYMQYEGVRFLYNWNIQISLLFYILDILLICSILRDSFRFPYIKNKVLHSLGHLWSCSLQDFSINVISSWCFHSLKVPYDFLYFIQCWFFFFFINIIISLIFIKLKWLCTMFSFEMFVPPV